jgi:acetyl esterase
MPVHPQVQAILDGVEAMGLPPIETLSVEEGRAMIGAFAQFMVPSEEVGEIIEAGALGPDDVFIPLRIYKPVGAGDDLPAILYFHGGGGVTGTIDLVDPVCRRLANRSGCAVVSVDYRLAPEHPFPAAVTDAYVATTWIAYKGAAFGIDGSRLVVMGDSIGATLATVTCMLLRDKAEEAEVLLQVLIYPVTDMEHDDTPSRHENGEGYLLTTGMMNWFKRHYMTGNDEYEAGGPYCSPLHMNDLSNLPAAIIVTAEYDPLRDEAVAYADRLKNEGGAFVDLRREAGMIHGFFWMGGVIDRGAELLDELGEDINKTLTG